MHRTILIVFALAVPAPSSAQWELAPGDANATVAGMGGGFMYGCASNAPSHGAIIVVFNDLALTGRRTGYVEVDDDRLSTAWQCALVAGSSMCAVATARDVPIIRDMLIRGSAAMAVLGSASSPLGAVMVGLQGSAGAIQRVRAACQ